MERNGDHEMGKLISDYHLMEFRVRSDYISLFLSPIFWCKFLDTLEGHGILNTGDS